MLPDTQKTTKPWVCIELTKTVHELSKLAKLEQTFFVLDLNFWIAQVEYGGQTRPELLTPNLWSMINTYYCVGHRLELKNFLFTFSHASLYAHQSGHQREKRDCENLKFTTDLQDTIEPFYCHPQLYAVTQSNISFLSMPIKQIIFRKVRTVNLIVKIKEMDGGPLVGQRNSRWFFSEAKKNSFE